MKALQTILSNPLVAVGIALLLAVLAFIITGMIIRYKMKKNREALTSAKREHVDLADMDKPFFENL